MIDEERLIDTVSKMDGKEIEKFSDTLKAFSALGFSASDLVLLRSFLHEWPTMRERIISLFPENKKKKAKAEEQSVADLLHIAGLDKPVITADFGGNDDEER